MGPLRAGRSQWVPVSERGELILPFKFAPNDSSRTAPNGVTRQAETKLGLALERARTGSDRGVFACNQRLPGVLGVGEPLPGRGEPARSLHSTTGVRYMKLGLGLALPRPN